MKCIFDLIADSPIELYIKKTTVITRLSRVFKQLLAEEWTANCELGNFENGQLILCVPNASWATKVHYAAPQLVTTLRQDPLFASLQTIKCKVMVKTPPSSSPAPSKQLSHPASEIIKYTAEGITDQKLKESLLRLASRTK